MVSGPITSWQIDGKTMETVTDFIFLDSKITGDGDCSHDIKQLSLLLRKGKKNCMLITKDDQVESVVISGENWRI